MRAYGDADALESVLGDRGWVRGHTLEGCRLAYVEYEGEPVMPYLDGEHVFVELVHADNGQKHWLVGEDGEEAQTLHGFINQDSRTLCIDCEGLYSDEQLIWHDGSGGYLCDRCVENNYTDAIIGAGQGGPWRELVHNNDVVGNYCGDRYTQQGADACTLITIDDTLHALDDCVEDALSGDWVPIEGATEFEDTDGEVLYTTDNDCLVESEDGTLLLKENASQDENGNWAYC